MPRPVVERLAQPLDTAEDGGRAALEVPHAGRELLLVQHSANETVSERGVLWQGARAGDAKERFVLYRVTQ